MNIQGYFDYINAPWGQLFYKLIWRNLSFQKKKILDFGSGFGVTANYLASNNTVVAIEPNTEMLQYRIRENEYTQLNGGINDLQQISDGSFDVIIAHNVLEYVNDCEKVISEFARLLKKGGVLSIVKHNRIGKIMHKAVFDYNIPEVLALLNDKRSVSENFGEINEYDINDIENIVMNFDLKNNYGVRTFYGLQSNSFKANENWIQEMYIAESAVEENEAFRNIAFFHHMIFEKKDK